MQKSGMNRPRQANADRNAAEVVCVLCGMYIGISTQEYGT